MLAALVHGRYNALVTFAPLEGLAVVALALLYHAFFGYIVLRICGGIARNTANPGRPGTGEGADGRAGQPVRPRYGASSPPAASLRRVNSGVHRDLKRFWHCIGSSTEWGPHIHGLGSKSAPFSYILYLFNIGKAYSVSSPISIHGRRSENPAGGTFRRYNAEGPGKPSEREVGPQKGAADGAHRESSCSERFTPDTGTPSHYPGPSNMKEPSGKRERQTII